MTPGQYKFIPCLHEFWSEPFTEANVGRTSVRFGTGNEVFHLKNQAGHHPTIILPDLCTHVVLQSYKSEQLSLKVVGPRSQPIRINRSNRKETLIFRLQPLYLNRLIPMPMSEMTDRSVSIFDLLSIEEKELLEAAANLTTSDGINVLWKILDRRRSHHPIPKMLSKAMAFIMEGQAGVKVRDLAKHIGCSERYLHRIMRSHVGLSPKLALNINRFSHSMRLRQRHKHLNWTAVAQSAGYYDQSHMIDEYQSFVGLPPSHLA